MKEKLHMYDTDSAADMVLKMRNKYLEEKGFRPYRDGDRWRAYVYWEEGGLKKRKPLTSKDLDKSTSNAKKSQKTR